MLISPEASGHVGHLEGLCRVGRQRLFAEDVLAGPQRRDRGRVVDRVRRDVGDGVELAPGQRRVERGEAVFDVVVGLRMSPAASGSTSTAADHGRRRRWRQNAWHGSWPCRRYRELGDAFVLCPSCVLERSVAPDCSISGSWLSAQSTLPACSACVSLAPRSTIGSSALSTGRFGAVHQLGVALGVERPVHRVAQHLAARSRRDRSGRSRGPGGSRRCCRRRADRSGPSGTLRRPGTRRRTPFRAAPAR